MFVISACAISNPDNCIYASEFGDRSTASTTIYAVNNICAGECKDTTCNNYRVGVTASEANYNSCVSECVTRIDSSGAAITSGPHHTSQCDTVEPGWVDSGLSVNGEVFIDISGTIQVCPRQPAAASSTRSDNYNYYIFDDGSPSNFITVAAATPILTPQSSSWINVEKNVAGIAAPGGTLLVRNGEVLEIEVAGEVNFGPAPGGGANVTHTDGTGLMIEVDMGTMLDPAGLPLGRTSWELNTIGQSTSMTDSTRGTVAVVLHRIVVMGNSPSLVKFRYNDVDGNYTNNTNGYDVRVRTAGCVGSNGRYLQAKFGATGTPIDMFSQPKRPYYPPRGMLGNNMYFKILDPEMSAPGATSEVYRNNSGSYTVSLDMMDTDRVFSSIMSFILDPVLEILYGKGSPRAGGVVSSIYTGIILGIRDAVRAGLILYVVLWGFGYVLGSIKTSTYEFVIRIIKIAIILELISDNSWRFFSEHLFNIFYDGINQFISMFTAQYGSLGGNNFEFMDRTVGVFFMSATWKKLAGLMLSGLIEFFYFICIIASMFIVVVAFAHAMLIYLISVIAIALLLSVAPIFIAFTLFQVTKPLFDGWLKHLVSYMLQPVLVLITLVLFTEIIIAFIYGVLSFTVCWACKIPINIPIGITDIRFCLMEWYQIWGNSPTTNHTDPNAAAFSSPSAGSTSGTRGLFAIIPLLIIADAMNKFTDWAVALAVTLTEAFNSSLLGATESMSKSTGMARLRARAKSMPGALAMAPVNQATGWARGAVERRVGRSMQKIGSAVGSESLKKYGAKQELHGDKLVKGNVVAQTVGGIGDGLSKAGSEFGKGNVGWGVAKALASPLVGLKRGLVGKGDGGAIGGTLSGAAGSLGGAFGTQGGMNKIGAVSGSLADGLFGKQPQNRGSNNPYAVSDGEVAAHLRKKYGASKRTTNQGAAPTAGDNYQHGANPNLDRLEIGDDE